MRKDTWTTYATYGYTRDVANDQRSAGGVHLHQVRRTRSGQWQRRTLQSNGRHEAAGSVEPIDAAAGEAAYEAARNAA